jgi:hypothetical protein
MGIDDMMTERQKFWTCIGIGWGMSFLMIGFCLFSKGQAAPTWEMVLCFCFWAGLGTSYAFGIKYDEKNKREERAQRERSRALHQQFMDRLEFNRIYYYFPNRYLRWEEVDNSSSSW